MTFVDHNYSESMRYADLSITLFVLFAAHRRYYKLFLNTYKTILLLCLTYKILLTYKNVSFLFTLCPYCFEPSEDPLLNSFISVTMHQKLLFITGFRSFLRIVLWLCSSIICDSYFLFLCSGTWALLCRHLRANKTCTWLKIFSCY